MRTALAWVAGVVVVAVVAWGAFHVFIPTINPAQKAPTGHPSSSCWTCHMVSENAKILESE